jgi:hypothetical protein
MLAYPIMLQPPDLRLHMDFGKRIKHLHIQESISDCGIEAVDNAVLPGQGVYQIAFETPIQKATSHLVPNETSHTNPIYFIHAPWYAKRLSSSSFYPSSPLTKPPTSDPQPLNHHTPSH